MFFHMLCVVMAIMPKTYCFPRAHDVTPSARALTPIVLIPGDGGSRLDVRVQRQGLGDTHCDVNADWFRIWLDIYQLRPGRLECFAKYMQLTYDSVTRTSQNQPGVEMRVPGFGDTASVERIDPSLSARLLGDAAAVFAPFVDELVTFGYERNKTIFGAPYDFRFAPHSLTSYYQDLRQLIEHASERNAGRKVVLVSHSLGGLVTLYFLRQQSQAWKDRYVHSFVPIATPWSGSVLMLHAMTSGYNFDIPLITPLTVRQQQRMSEASLLLVPRAPAWQPNDVLIATPTKNYSMTSYDEWFDDIGFSVGKYMKRNVQTEAYALEHPGVHMCCWYGSGVSTANVLVYDTGFPDSQPVRALHTDGDGVVMTSSLSSCRHFMTNSEYINDIRAFDANHVKILANKTLIRSLLVDVIRDRRGAVPRDTKRQQAMRLVDYFFNFW